MKIKIYFILMLFSLFSAILMADAFIKSKIPGTRFYESGDRWNYFILIFVNILCIVWYFILNSTYRKKK